MRGQVNPWSIWSPCSPVFMYSLGLFTFTYFICFDWSDLGVYIVFTLCKSAKNRMYYSCLVCKYNGLQLCDYVNARQWNLYALIISYGNENLWFLHPFVSFTVWLIAHMWILGFINSVFCYRFVWEECHVLYVFLITSWGLSVWIAITVSFRACI